MHGNKATEISIQWSLKSSLPAQNAQNKPPHIISPAVLLFQLCDDDKDHDCVKGKWLLSTLLFLTVQSICSMQGTEQTSTTTFQNPYKLIDGN